MTLPPWLRVVTDIRSWQWGRSMQWTDEILQQRSPAMRIPLQMPTETVAQDFAPAFFMAFPSGLGISVEVVDPEGETEQPEAGFTSVDIRPRLAEFNAQDLATQLFSGANAFHCFFLGVAAPLKMVQAPKRVPFVFFLLSPRVAEQLRPTSPGPWAARRSAAPSCCNPWPKPCPGAQPEAARGRSHRKRWSKWLWVSLVAGRAGRWLKG